MRRSNSKAAVDAIKKYILEQYDPEVYELPATSDFREAARNIWAAFLAEKVRFDKRRMSYQEYFLEWLSDLPSIVNTADYLYRPNAKKRLADILAETETEADKYTETEAEQMLSRLIWREVSKAAN